MLRGANFSENRSAPENCEAKRVLELPVASLDDIARVFADLFNDENSSVILGPYVGDDAAVMADGGLIPTRPLKGANFVDRLSNVIIFDAGVSTAETDREKLMLEIRATLPRMFHNLDFVGLVKPSIDLKKTQLAYLAFWMPEPMTLEQVRALVKKEKCGMFQKGTLPFPDKLIHTAKPRVEDGFVDPVLTRQIYVKGMHAIPTDHITVLECHEQYNLTKTYLADGTRRDADAAASFKEHKEETKGWPGLRDLLSTLHKMPKCCPVRGAFVGRSAATKGRGPGFFVRDSTNFNDQPLHWFMIDVDNFEPDFVSSIDHTELAVQDYIAQVLAPKHPAFLRASFYWHLSSSAGVTYEKVGQDGSRMIIEPGNKLKCHIHFISKTPYTSAQMTAFAKDVGPQVDASVFRRVQYNYTADPIFEGREDPIRERSGFHQGTDEYVDLVLCDSLLTSARVTGSGEGGNDMKLVDPSEKDGLIGLFHKTFSAEQVLLQLLDGDFEYVSQRRWTWLTGGGGTKEGVWVHDDDMHVGSSHNTWPIVGIANLWDLVREFKFGHLDEVETEDAFERENAEGTSCGHRPSDQAMREYAAGLDEIKAQQAEEAEQGAKDRQATLEGWRAKIRSAPDEGTLREIVCPGIAADSTVSDQQRDALSAELNKKLKAWGETPGIGAAKKLIKQASTKPKNDNSPDWLRDWYYVTDRDLFYQYDTDQWLSSKGFNAKHNRLCPKDDEGNRMSAEYVALEVFPIKVVTRGVYLPVAGKNFTWPGVTCVNTYRPSSVPKEADTLSVEGLKVVSVIAGHLLALCSGRQWLADRLIDFMAHNVQYPSLKIRHVPVIQGIEGDGKSLIGTLLAQVMGEPNVNVISPEVISKSDFNGWSEGACVGVLEEIRLQGTNRFDVLNSLKPGIANDNISVHRKGKDPYNAPNTMNYIAFTNHKDALPLKDDDRRWLVIFVPWRDIKQFAKIVGCEPGEYFDRLHDCIFNHAASLRRWFLDRDLSGFKRNSPAPMTDEKSLMIGFGVSEETTVARELIESGGVGFSDKVVSTRMLSRAMVSSGVDAPKTNFMQRLMLDFGYRKFPEPVKWGGDTHRPVWTKELVTDKDAVRRLLDATAESQLEDDFID